MTRATANGTFPGNAREAAARYLDLGRIPIPVPRTGNHKHPTIDGWTALRPRPEELAELFPPHVELNVGLLLGEPSHGLIDVDLDAPEAIAAGPLLLPSTGWISGRRSKPKSHWWYQVADPPAKAAENYDDDARDPQESERLLELRSTGGHTVAPPGVHESGEQVVWYVCTSPAEVTLAELRAAVGEVAACALLARHWPGPGSHRRQDAYLHLSGGLARAGWSEERAEKFIGALAEVLRDEEAQKRVETFARTAAKLVDGEKVTGWPKLAALLGQHGKSVIDLARRWLGIAVPQAPADPPVPEPPPWPDPPGEEAFHGLAGKIVRAIEPASEADPAALLVQILVAFGNAAGRASFFTVEADRHHPNEFAVLVGRTSKARKGTSWGHVSRLFREVEEQWAADRVQSGVSSGEGIVWAVRDPIRKRERVRDQGEVRYEEVEADPGVADKRLLVYEPEFANVLKQTERQGNILSAVLRQGWDGLDLRTLAKNSPARATGAHVSLIGHITADELRRYLTQTEMANGYANRHLWVCAERSKLLPEGGRVDPQAWEAVRSELVEALAFARSAGEVTRDEEARAVWCEVYGDLSEGRPGLAGALLARAEAHVMRLAMLYALLDRSAQIRAPHLLAALALWDYCERSVYFVFGDCLGDPLADDLLRLLRRSPDGLTRTDMSHYLGRNQAADRIGRALGLLLQHNLARCERQDTGGRPAERWFAITGGRAR